MTDDEQKTDRKSQVSSDQLAAEVKSLTADEGLAGDKGNQQQRLKTLAPTLLGLAAVRAEADSQGISIYAAARRVLDRVSDGWHDPTERLALRYSLGIEGEALTRADRMASGTLTAHDLGITRVTSSTLDNKISRNQKRLLNRFADVLIEEGRLQPSTPGTDSSGTETITGASAVTAPRAAPDGPDESAAADATRNDETAAKTDRRDEPVVAPEPRSRPSWISSGILVAAALFVGLVAGGLAVYLVIGGDDERDGLSAEQRGGSLDDQPVGGAEGPDDETGEAPSEPEPGGEPEADPSTSTTEPAPATDDTPTSTPVAQETEPTPIPAPPSPVQLVTLVPLSGDYFESESRSAGTIWPSSGTVGGESTGRILVASVDGGFSSSRETEVTFALDGQYEFLDLQLVYSPTSDSSGAALVTIFVDDQTVIFSEAVGPGDSMEVERRPLNGGNQMRILVEETNESLCRTDSDTGCEIWFLVADLIPLSS